MSEKKQSVYASIADDIIMREIKAMANDGKNVKIAIAKSSHAAVWKSFSKSAPKDIYTP